MKGATGCYFCHSCGLGSLYKMKLEKLIIANINWCFTYKCDGIKCAEIHPWWVQDNAATPLWPNQPSQVVNLYQVYSGCRQRSAFGRAGNVRTEVVLGESCKSTLIRSLRPICKCTPVHRNSEEVTSWPPLGEAEPLFPRLLLFTEATHSSCRCRWGRDLMCGREQICVQAFENERPAAAFSPTEPLNYGFMHKFAGLPWCHLH